MAKGSQRNLPPPSRAADHATVQFCWAFGWGGVSPGLMIGILPESAGGGCVPVARWRWRQHSGARLQRLGQVLAIRLFPLIASAGLNAAFLLLLRRLLRFLIIGLRHGRHRHDQGNRKDKVRFHQCLLWGDNAHQSKRLANQSSAAKARPGRSFPGGFQALTPA